MRALLYIVTLLLCFNGFSQINGDYKAIKRKGIKSITAIYKFDSISQNEVKRQLVFDKNGALVYDIINETNYESKKVTQHYFINGRNFLLSKLGNDGNFYPLHFDKDSVLKLGYFYDRFSVHERYYHTEKKEIRNDKFITIYDSLRYFNQNVICRNNFLLCFRVNDTYNDTVRTLESMMYLDSIVCKKIGYDYCTMDLKIDSISKDTLACCMVFQKRQIIKNRIVIEKIDNDGKNFTKIKTLRDYRNLTEKDTNIINTRVILRQEETYKLNKLKKLVINDIQHQKSETYYNDEAYYKKHAKYKPYQDSFKELKEYEKPKKIIVEYYKN